MPDKYFPIKTDTSCQLKWTWSTMRLYTGQTSSCHRVQPDVVGVDDFENFHNTPKKIADRELMLNGEWPQGGCEYCKNIEDAGGSSDRMFHLKIPNLVPPELDTDLNATSVTPRIVEVYFDNVCNMSCLYCWDGFSSKIRQENLLYGRFEQAGVVIDNRANKVPDITALTDRFWQWMSDHHTSIRRLHVLGGEPLYQRQFEQCLDFFSRNPCPELEFNVISNLMIPDEKFQNIIQRIKTLVTSGHLARFDLTASIDCFGPEQEYVRHGMELAQWRRNFEYLVAQPWITLNINQTLSALTIKTVPELLQYVNPLRENREIGHYFSTTTMTHLFLHPDIFGKGFYDSEFQCIIDNMPDNTWQQKQARMYMDGIQKQLSTTTRSPERIHQLGIFLDEIDRRRGLNWRNTFPWLEKEINNVV